MKKENKCPDCGHTNTVSVGSYLTKKWGNQKRRKCKNCATTFYENYPNMEAK